MIQLKAFRWMGGTRHVSLRLFRTIQTLVGYFSFLLVVFFAKDDPNYLFEDGEVYSDVEAWIDSYLFPLILISVPLFRS
jgi:hypothetical protein